MYLSPFNRLLRILWGHHFFFLIGLLLFTVGSPLPGNLAQELLGVGQDEVCIGVQGCPLKAFHYSAHCPQSQWTPAPPDTVYQESESWARPGTQPSPVGSFYGAFLRPWRGLKLQWHQPRASLHLQYKEVGDAPQSLEVCMFMANIILFELYSISKRLGLCSLPWVAEKLPSYHQLSCVFPTTVLPYSGTLHLVKTGVLLPVNPDSPSPAPGPTFYSLPVCTWWLWMEGCCVLGSHGICLFGADLSLSTMSSGFICVGAGVGIPFLFEAEWYSLYV